MACSRWQAAKDTGRETSLCEYCLQMSMDYIILCVSSNLLFVTGGSRTGSTRGADRHLNGVPGVSDTEVVVDPHDLWPLATYVDLSCPSND